MPEQPAEHTEKVEQLRCGIIMPISAMPNTNYTETHWKNVKDIIERAAKAVNFIPRMVSDSDPTAIIQKAIIDNIYYDEIVVCDASGKNPNVMFELGMRLAFDKPVVIIKDDETNYTFDIGLIQHMEYPKSLNFHTIERFIKDLSSKILNTYNSYISDPHSNSFLRHFGEFEIQKLNPKSLDEKELMNMMNSSFEGLQRDIRRLSGRINILSHNTNTKFSEIEDYLSSRRQHASQINFDDNMPF